MAQVSIFSKLVVKDGKADQFVASLDALYEELGSEPGTVVHLLNRSGSDPNVFWLYELYRDQDSYQAHAKSESLAAWMGNMGDFVEGGELIIGEPVRGKCPTA